MEAKARQTLKKYTLACESHRCHIRTAKLSRIYSECKVEYIMLIIRIIGIFHIHVLSERRDMI